MAYRHLLNSISRFWLGSIAVAMLAAVLAIPASAKDRLVIGMTQFPSTLHPMIDSMLAKTYVLAMTSPPVVHYDHDWKAACKVCVELPGLDNGLAVLEATAEGAEGMAVTYRLHPEICRLSSEAFYEGKLRSAAGCERQEIRLPDTHTPPLWRRSGIVFVPVEHRGNTQGSDEEAGVVRDLLGRLIGCEHVGRGGTRAGRLGIEDVLIVAPYNMQVRKLQQILPEGARVGSVDKFQGQEAPVVIVSMDGCPKHSRIRLLFASSSTAHSGPGLSATPSAAAATASRRVSTLSGNVTQM